MPGAMRLYLLPISTRRTLLYCQRLTVATKSKQTWVDRIQDKSARTWAEWEKADGGWKKHVVRWGNQAFRQIPYEEWGLKSVPPLSQYRREVEGRAYETVEVVYPQTLLPMDRIPHIIETLATEREALHKKRLLWCLIGMPITAPVALVPLIPNLPFFYLVYRAWSHSKAIAGGRHLQFLVNKNLLTLTPSPILDQVYAKQRPPLPSSPEPTTDSDVELLPDATPASKAAEENSAGETMLLSQASGKKMTQELDLPQLEVEMERAIWQVEEAIRKQNKEAEEGSKAEGQENKKDK